MNKIIHNYLNNQFDKIIKQVRNQHIHIDESIFNQKRLKFYPKGKYSYDGYNYCGLITKTINEELAKKYPLLNFELQYNSIGYDKYLEDHVYLKLDNIIIDPTYKQFLINSLCNGNSKYSNELYINLPPFFIGNYEHLDKIIDQMILLDKITFGQRGLLPKSEIIQWWQNKKFYQK